MSRPRGRPVRPILARIADYIEGMDYLTLKALLSSPDIADNNHWRWTGPIDIYTLSGIRTRGNTYDSARPYIKIGNVRTRADRIIFAYWTNNGEPLDPRLHVRQRPECGWKRCVNPNHKRLLATFDHRLEERPAIPGHLGARPQAFVEEDIADLMDLVYEYRHLSVRELAAKFVDFTADEITEALRRTKP